MNSSKVFEFVEKLKAVAGEGRFCNMWKTGIQPECNAPGCHAGWAAIALGVKTDDFMKGANALAKFFGFDSHGELERWADSNSDDWGNT